MGSVVFTDTYSQTGYNAQTQNVRLNYSESYNTSTNSTTISLDSIDFSTTLNVPNCPVRGAVDFNSTNVIDMPSSTVAYNVTGGGGSYGRVSQSYGVRTISVTHNADGTASFTAYLKTASSSGYNTFGIQYDTKYWGVRTPASKTISLTKHTSTLTVNPNGGIWGGSGSSQNFSQAPTSAKSIGAPSRTGYTFAGWVLSGGGSWNGTTYTFGASNGTLTANWTINTWSVSYDANGGSDAPASQTKTYGQTLVLSADIPTRTGYTFKGWATTPDASVAQYQPSGNYTANQAATLYAVWQINQYSLSVTKSEAGLALNVTRTESSIAGAATGILSSGDVIYYGDKLTVAYALSAGYAIDTATINGVDMGGTSEAVTVSSNVAVIVLVELQALTYIDNGASIDMYQIYIDDGNSLSAYQAYIDNGVSWDVY